MFVTSLPISFAGWGLRELSAASTLSLIGTPPEVAVAAAVAIGLLYLAATGLFGAVGLLLLAGRRRTAGTVQPEQGGVATQNGFSIGQDWDGKVVQGCAILGAVLLFFRIPTQLANRDVLINVNVADVIVFVALSVILLMIAAGRIRSLFPPFLTLALAVLSAVIGFGLINSYARDNLGDWALYMRGVGWVLMLGYTALGAATVKIAGDEGRMLILRSLMIAAMSICVLQLSALAWSTFVFPVPSYVLAYPLQGFANNQNAFCFELAMIGLLLIVGRNMGLFEGSQRLFATTVALLTLTIYFTGSRTGAVFVITIALLDNLLAGKWTGTRLGQRSHATLLASLAIVAAILLPYAVYGAALALHAAFGLDIDADWLFAALAQPDAGGTTRLLHPSSDIERWETIVGGLRLWADSPFLGAGLGAYVEWLRETGQRAQGIHSVYIWFLAEMGVIGLAAVLGLGAMLAVSAWRMMARQQSAPWGFTVLGVLSFMAIGGLVQDFFYQRIFWFVLGLTAAIDAKGAEESSDAGTFLAVVAILGLLVFILAL